MSTCTDRMLMEKKYCLPPLLFIAGISISSAAHLFTITPNDINSGGGTSSSPSYSTNYSLGQLAIGSLGSVSYQIQTDVVSLPDTDTDAIPDSIDNCPSVTNIDQTDTDADTSGDACDLDDDNDGLSDATELALGTNPLLVDTDGDGLDDGNDPNPLIPNADGDLAPYGAPDGIINIADLLIARQIVLGDITPTMQDIIHGDIYPAGAPDGVIDISDLILLEQMVLSAP